MFGGVGHGHLFVEGDEVIMLDLTGATIGAGGVAAEIGCLFIHTMNG